MLANFHSQKFAQSLHKICTDLGGIEIIQLFEKAEFCTKVAQLFLPELATVCHKILANKGIHLLL
jgi:hypothetical protein